MGVLGELRAKFHTVWPLLDERTRRLLATSDASALGYGGVSLVHCACGLSRKAIAKGIREIEEGAALPAGRIRRPGAGRKCITVSDPRLLRDYETVVNLIAKTTTAKGLTVTCRLDRRKYATGRTVTHADMKRINLHPDRFHREWNYVIRPHETPQRGKIS